MTKRPESKFQALARWLRTVPARFWIIALAVFLVGGRYLWVRAQRPPHEREVAGTFGALRSISGPPQSDHAGKRIAYIANADVGMGVFVRDLATGQERNVRETWAETDFNFPNLRLWPWSSDDNAVIPMGDACSCATRELAKPPVLWTCRKCPQT